MIPWRDILKCLSGLFGAVGGSEGVVPSLGVSLVASLGAKSIIVSCKQKAQQNLFTKCVECTKCAKCFV